MTAGSGKENMGIHPNMQRDSGVEDIEGNYEMQKKKFVELWVENDSRIASLEHQPVCSTSCETAADVTPTEGEGNGKPAIEGKNKAIEDQGSSASIAKEKQGLDACLDNMQRHGEELIQNTSTKLQSVKADNPTEKHSTSICTSEIDSKEISRRMGQIHEICEKEEMLTLRDQNNYLQGEVVELRAAFDRLFCFILRSKQVKKGNIDDHTTSMIKRLKALDCHLKDIGQLCQLESLRILP